MNAVLKVSNAKNLITTELDIDLSLTHEIPLKELIARELTIFLTGLDLPEPAAGDDAVHIEISIKSGVFSLAAAA
jgi:hypothetical protein